MPKILEVTVICLLLLFAKSTHSNGTENFSYLRFKSFSTHEGLSQSSVLSLTQDAQGFIWLGTKDGLNRFDGYNFITYKNKVDDPKSISNNEIIFLEGDSLGNIFVGTRGGGLNYFIKDENRFVRYSNLKTLDGTVNCVLQNNDGSIWVGTSDGLYLGLPDPTKAFHYYFTNYSKKSVYLHSNESLLPYDRSIISVVTIKKMNNETLLIGTYKGLFQFKLKDLSFKQIDLGKLNKAKINSMLWDKKSFLWVATSEGLVKLNIKNEKIFSRLPFDNNNPVWKKLNAGWVENLNCDFEGNIWIATRGAGVVVINKEGEISEYINDGSSSDRIGDNIINALMIDRTGILWMGTESKGVITLDLNRRKFNHLENNTETGINLTSNLVTAITGNDEEIWVGTAYNGLDYLRFNNDQTISTKHFDQIPFDKGLSSGEIISLLVDQEKTLWIGTASNNLVSYRKDLGFKSFYTGGFAFALHQDSDDDIWIGTWGKGLGLMQNSSNQIQFFSNQPNDSQTLSGDIILSIFDDNQGNLWIGTKGRGLNVIPLKLIKQGYTNFVSFDMNSTLLHNDIYCIFQDSENIIWIGTGGGLNKLDLYTNKNHINDLYKGRAQFTSFTEKDGLPANLIYGILEDHDKNLWISTTKGLSKYNKKTNTFNNYNSNDGLQSNEFHSNAFYSSPNRKLFFGGVNGLSFFDPAEITKNSTPSTVILSGLKVANIPVKPNEKIMGSIILKTDIAKAEEIELRHKHKDFSIEFSALHFNNLDGVIYAYRLIGFNDQWRYLNGTEHSVSYTNLWEGDYTFEVKSMNSNGDWNTPTTTLKIKILPPYWRHPWFYAIYLALFIFGLLLFRQYSLIGVAEKNRLLIEHIERANLIDNTEAKMRFFTNISHEIRSPLTLISNPLDEVISKGQIDEKSRSSLLLVSKNVNRLLHLTNQLLQLRKIDKGGLEPQFTEVDLVPFVKEIISYFLQKALNKEITLSFHSNIDAGEKIWIDTEMITTAIYNVISNAYKFTPSKGKITIRLYKEWDEISKIEKLKRKKANNKKQWYCIDISDTGSGISADDLQNIFHRFYQGKQNTNKELAGSGIGLSIVKEYIDLHQGKLSTKSKLGEGSTFTLCLPQGNEHVKNKQKSNISVSTTSQLQAIDEDFNHQNQIVEEKNKQNNLPSILLVEDDKDLSDYLVNNLANKYQLSVAFDGAKGIDKAIELLPDLIISDVMMPFIDGLELCQAIKTNEKTRHIPIILLTAKAADDSKIEGYQSGADLYVSKPFKIEVLVSQIDQLLQTRKTLSAIFSKQITLEPRNIAISSADEKFLLRLNEVIDDHLSESDFDVSAMVEKMNLSHSTVLKKVKALTDMPLVEFVKIHRLKRAAQILEQKQFQIAEVAYMVGFSDPKYFSKCFSKEFGKTPTEYVQEVNKMKTDQEKV